MPFTAEDRFYDTSLHGKASHAQQGFEVLSIILDTLSPTSRATALQFATLLSSAPADLGRISDEIRSHPDLEILVMRLLASVAICPQVSAGSVEEATVVLGIDRLQVLVVIWLLVHEKGTPAGFVAQPEIANVRGVAMSSAANTEAPWTSGTPYLTSLMRWIGLDSAPSGGAFEGAFCADRESQRERFAGLPNISIGDFISLILLLYPAVLEPIGKAAWPMESVYRQRIRVKPV